MEIFNFLWLIWDNYIPKAPTKNNKPPSVKMYESTCLYVTLSCYLVNTQGKINYNNSILSCSRCLLEIEKRTFTSWISHELAFYSIMCKIDYNSSVLSCSRCLLEIEMYLLFEFAMCWLFIQSCVAHWSCFLIGSCILKRMWIPKFETHKWPF